MAEKREVVIIGGGFGGLTCAQALAKEGMKVTVLEKCAVPGGAFQSFCRHGQRLDTGFHYVGGIGEGEVLHPLVTYFGLEDLPWQPLDDEFLEVHTHGQTFRLHRGYPSFVDHLSADFPEERTALEKIVSLMTGINKHIYESILPGQNAFDNILMGVSAKTYLEANISNPVLRDLLCGQCLTTELTDKLPLYSFLQSLNSFIQGSYRLKGGGETLINRLVENVQHLGGEVIMRKTVSQFEVNDDGNICAVKCTDGTTYKADIVVSTLHPSLTIDLIPECKQVRNIYRRRIQRLESTVGMFTVQLEVQPNTIPYLNRSISIIETDNLWNAPCGKEAPVNTMLINFNVPEEGKFATNIDLLIPMSWDAVSDWEESRLGHRPEEYMAFKQQKAEECIAFALPYVPELKGNIVNYWTSTPLTYRDYTGTQHGSSYGIRKSFDNLLGTLVSPVSPLPNLYLAGQSLMLHGMLGTAMTSMLTCNIICGKNLLEK